MPKGMSDRTRARMWPDEHVAKMIELNNLRYSATQIMIGLNKEFGTSYTRNAICGKLDRTLGRTRKANTGWVRPSRAKKKPVGYGVQTIKRRVKQLREAELKQKQLEAAAANAPLVPSGTDQNHIHPSRRQLVEAGSHAIEDSDISTEPKLFADLGDGECKWPVVGPDARFWCCARKQFPGKPYCVAHYARGVK